MDLDPIVIPGLLFKQTGCLEAQVSLIGRDIFGVGTGDLKGNPARRGLFQCDLVGKVDLLKQGV